MIERDEQVDDLGRGLRIIQKRQGFKYGTDSVLLAKFVQMSRDILPGRCAGSLKCVDLGTGTGILPLLLSRDPRFSEISGLEIQADYAEMAARSIAMNCLEDRLHIVKGDIKNAAEIYGRASVQAVVTNPPYKKLGEGIRSISEKEAVARHEVCCTLEDVIRSSSLLLSPGGGFFMIHRPERLADAMEFMRKYRLEPKYLQFVFPKPGRRPSMFLTAAVRGGGHNLVIQEPLILMDREGRETEELRKIYAY